MPKNFWKNLNKPILAVAPMYDITDTVFRQIIANCGKPSVFFTEFISVDGLLHPKSQDRLIKYFLRFDEIERPLVAQIWGTDPEKFYESAKLISRLGFDGIDINMGCPDKAVVKAGAGSALILNPKLAQEIISETKRGAGDIPISVKTRLGFTTNIIEKWLPCLMEAEPAVITIHGRTMKQMSKVPADWNSIAQAKKIADKSGKEILILGNGDVRNLNDAYEKIRTYGVDGVMVGRGVLGNPWFFNPKKNNQENESAITPKERFEILEKHVALFEKYFDGLKNFHMLKKHIKSHISGFDGAKETRSSLMNSKTLGELKSLIKNIAIPETLTIND